MALLVSRARPDSSSSRALAFCVTVKTAKIHVFCEYLNNHESSVVHSLRKCVPKFMIRYSEKYCVSDVSRARPLHGDRTTRTWNAKNIELGLQMRVLAVYAVLTHCLHGFHTV
jgi:hypothetical protein